MPPFRLTASKNIFNLRRGSKELSTPQDENDNIPIPSRLKPQQRRTILSNERSFTPTNQKLNNSQLNTSTELNLKIQNTPSSSSAYIAPIIKESIPLIVKKRTKPQFDFTQLTGNELQQLEIIHQRLTKTNNSRSKSNDNSFKIDEEYQDIVSPRNVNQYSLSSEQKHNNNEVDMKWKIPSNFFSRQTYRKNNNIKQNEKQPSSEITLDLVKNLEESTAIKKDKDIYRNKQTNLYFIKDLKDGNQNLEKFDTSTLPNYNSENNQYMQNSKNLSLQLPQQKNILNGLNQNAINELMAIKDLPNLNELTKGLDLSLLNRPGGYDILKQQFIQRFIIRSLNLPTGSKNLTVSAN